ncbi:MAG: DUF362 domain-containing protein [Acidobacteriota bacterium]
MPPNRRAFIRNLAGGVGGLALTGGLTPPPLRTGPAPGAAQPSRVALVKGNDRRGNMLKALEILEPQIRQALGDRQVVIKPNLTRVRKQDWLASTTVESVAALCELFSVLSSRPIIIAEGTGPGAPLQEALENYNYLDLTKRFRVEFVDLRDDHYDSAYIVDRDFRPLEIKVSRLLTRHDTFLVSAAVLKTHGLAAVTLGLKNVTMAIPMNFGPGRNDRSKMHQDIDDPRPFNWNLFQVSRLRTPDLVTIDGFVGMQGNGPLNGDPVEAKVAVAGLDWLAADRVGTEVMGMDFGRIAHYRYCAEAGMGEADLARIQVVGNTIGECRRQFAPPDALERILMPL